MSLTNDLQRPDAYSLQPGGAQDDAHVEFMQTHISLVFLMGEFAYKVKKPIKLSFLDFSTLELRKRYCDEELRTNRRLAPHLYLEVVPITLNGEGRHVVGGMGEPVDFAVKMRRFPESAVLSHVLARGELKPAHIDALAREVAEFHAMAEVAPESSPFGKSETVLTPVVECFDHVQATAPSPNSTGSSTDAEHIEHLRQWVLHEHASLQSLFEARRREGRIRECHGDMHLGNMLLEVVDQPAGVGEDTPHGRTGLSALRGEPAERVTIFDGIEFNEAFRWIDVLSEVAFTMMDLTDRGRADYAWRFLNGYLEHTGDYQGLGVLRFYLVYRALVRAKVAGIRLKQAEITADDRREQEEQQSSYLELAVEYSRPPAPRLILAHGPSGSGKSTWTQPLLEQLPAVRVRSDVERKRLAGLEAESHSNSPLDAGLYVQQSTARTYSQLAECAGAILTAGHSAILDATFLQRAQRDVLYAVATERHVPCVVLDFQCPEEELRRRIEHRAAGGHDASEATTEVLERQLQRQESVTKDEQARVVPIDTQLPPTNERVHELCRMLQQ